MISIHLCTSEDSVYEDVCAFAEAGYYERYGIKLLMFPEVFVYATVLDGEISGCFGAYCGSIHQPLTTEWYVPPEDMCSILGKNTLQSSREMLYEIGTRVVKLPVQAPTNSVRLSVAMAAALLPYLAKQGGQYSLFTADRSVYVIAKQLQVDLKRLGPPDLSRQTKAYREYWQPYFEVTRECFAIDLRQAALGSSSMCNELFSAGFIFDPVLSIPNHNVLEVAV